MNKNTYSTSTEYCKLSRYSAPVPQVGFITEAALIEELSFIPEPGPFHGSSIEFLHTLDLPDQTPKKDRAKSQSSLEIACLTDAASDSLVELTAVELQAGPTARLKIENAKRFQAAPGLHKDRVSVTRQRLVQRNALARVMQVQFHSDVVTTLNDKSREYLDILTALSANVAVLSGTGWNQAQSWLGKNVPVVFALVGPVNVKAMFDGHLDKAHRELSSKIIMSRKDFMTGPTAKEIAHRLEITIEQLRIAKANKFGLTSINPQCKKDRDRETITAKRREMGVKPQASRTKIADLQAIADRIGKSLSTVRRHDKAGTLSEYLKAFSVDEQNVSCGYKNIYDTTEIVHSIEDSQHLDIEQHFGESDYADHIGADDAAFPIPRSGDDDWTLEIQEGQACHAAAYG